MASRGVKPLQSFHPQLRRSERCASRICHGASRIQAVWSLCQCTVVKMRNSWSQVGRASSMGLCRLQQDNSEIALRGTAILARMLLGIIPPAAMPEPLQRAASSLHDQCLLVRLCQTLMR